MSTGISTISAKLVAYDEMTAVFRKVTAEAGLMANQVKANISKMAGMKDMLRPVGGIGALIGGSAVVATMKSGVQGLAEAEAVNAKLKAVLKATGGAAGYSAEQLDRMASEYRKVTNVDDDAIKGAQTLMATFKNVKGGIFKDAIANSLDMSAVLGNDLSSAATQVGKALNDPLKGFKSLSDSGVKFTQVQQDNIKAMVKLNDTAGAQRAILDALSATYGGAAVERGQSLAGTLDAMSLASADLAKNFGQLAVPAVRQLADTMSELNRLTSETVGLKHALKDVEAAGNGTGSRRDVMAQLAANKAMRDSLEIQKQIAQKAIDNGSILNLPSRLLNMKEAYEAHDAIQALNFQRTSLENKLKNMAPLKGFDLGGDREGFLKGLGPSLKNIHQLAFGTANGDSLKPPTWIKQFHAGIEKATEAYRTFKDTVASSEAAARSAIMQRAKAESDAVRTPMEEYFDRQRELRELVKENAGFTESDYNRAMAKEVEKLQPKSTKTYGFDDFAEVRKNMQLAAMGGKKDEQTKIQKDQQIELVKHTTFLQVVSEKLTQMASNAGISFVGT